MSFNINSGMLIASSIFSLIFLILLNLWYRNKAEYSGLLYIVIAYLLISVNGVLILFRQETAKPVSFIIENFLSVTYYPLYYMGLTSIFNLKNKFRPDYFHMASVLVLLIIFSYFYPSYLIRLIIVSVFIVFFNVKILINLSRIKLEKFQFWTISIFIALILISNWYILNLILVIKNQNEYFRMTISFLDGMRWAVLLTALAGIGLYFISVITFFQREKLASLATQRETILKETHHRVKNNLTLLTSLINSKKLYFQDPVFVSSLEDVSSQIMTVTEIHDNLYRASEFTTVRLDQYIDDLIKSIKKIHIDKNFKIEFQVQIDEIKVNSKLCLSIGLLLNELITNSIKYAFPEGNPGVVEISITEEMNFLNIRYSDNGVGFECDDTSESGDGFGLSLIKTMSRQLNARMEVNTENGCRYSFIVPIPQSRESKPDPY